MVLPVIEGSVDDRQVRAAFARLEKVAEDPRAALEEIGEAWHRSIQRNFDAGGRPDRWHAKRDGRPSRLQASARLRWSTHYKAQHRSVRMFNNTRYARIHHEGGEIKAKAGKSLAIPLEDSTLTRGGLAALIRRRPDDTFVLKRDEDGNKRGTVMLKVGDDRVRPIFVLRRRVKMPARPWLLTQDEDWSTFEGILLDHIRAAVA